jgi:Tfp pilus assembly protein PilN
MRPVNLDFYPTKSRPANAVGLVLLLVGLLLSAYLVHLYSQSNIQQEKLESELARLHAHQQGGKASPDDKELGAALQRASAVIDRLAFPWDKLFKTLESSTDGEDVTLLSIQPDVPDGTVMLNAEARDWNAMVSYIRHLNKEEFFTDVHLVSHQIQQTDPQKPIRFVLSCSWGSAQTR